jgi:hypothetical protein
MSARILLDFFVMTRRVLVNEPQTCRGFLDAFPPLIRFSNNLSEEK